MSNKLNTERPKNYTADGKELSMVVHLAQQKWSGHQYVREDHPLAHTKKYT
jgi:hypothetical protein